MKILLSAAVLVAGVAEANTLSCTEVEGAKTLQVNLLADLGNVSLAGPELDETELYSFNWVSAQKSLVYSLGKTVSKFEFTLNSPNHKLVMTKSTSMGRGGRGGCGRGGCFDFEPKIAALLTLGNASFEFTCSQP